jgi:hypothetical protein
LRRVAPARYRARAPSEPHVHVIRAYGSSKPRRAVQECRIAGFLRAPVARR